MGWYIGADGKKHGDGLYGEDMPGGKGPISWQMVVAAVLMGLFPLYVVGIYFLVDKILIRLR